MEARTMPATLPGNVKELIDRANFAHLATLMEDGSPHSTPLWVGRDGDRLMSVTSGNSLKPRNTKREPRVAIPIIDSKDPDMEAQPPGRLVEHPSASRF